MSGWGTRRCSSAAQGDCVIYAEELAENAGTITNELFSRLGARVEGRCFRQEA